MKLIKCLIYSLTFVICTISFAGSLKINVNPQNPIFNEPFEVEFVISSKNEAEPVISFDPLGAEIVSRSNGAVSTRTSYINGKMTFERTISVRYEMIAPRAGQAYLRSIKVDVGDDKIVHKTKAIRILKAPLKARDIFVKAEVDKEQYYVGESIVLRYYLYNKENIPLRSTDVKKFPKLNKFLKRFHQEQSVVQRVQVDGTIYLRRIIYTAQLFGENPGAYKIDPISLNVSYSDRGRRNSLNSFGFGMQIGRMKRKSVRSKPVEIQIIPIPSENLPSNFTGLVGDHQFKLKTNKTKYLSNEPIEYKLTIEGDGALELFEAPKIILSDKVEEFETNSDLEVKSDFTSKKTFDYTYLGRGSVKFDSRNLKLSYFDPSSKSFKEVSLDIGSLEVVAIGNQAAANINLKKEASKKVTQNQPKSILGNEPISFEPIYKTLNSYIYYSKHLFYLVGSLLIILLVFFVFKQLKKLKLKDKSLLEEIMSSGLTYNRLYRFIMKLGDEDSMEKVIANSQLREDSKKYFLGLISQINNSYDKNMVNKKVKANKKHFNELIKYVKKTKNEDFQFNSRV